MDEASALLYSTRTQPTSKTSYCAAMDEAAALLYATYCSVHDGRYNKPIIGCNGTKGCMFARLQWVELVRLCSAHYSRSCTFGSNGSFWLRTCTSAQCTYAEDNMIHSAHSSRVSAGGLEVGAGDYFEAAVGVLCH